MPNLQELLGEELWEQVKPKLGDNHIVIDKSEGNWLPKEKFDTVNNDNKELKKQLKERDTQLEELSQKAKGNEELTNQINDLKTQNEQTKTDYQARLDKQSFDFSLDNALRDAKAKNPKALKALLDHEALKQDGSKILGLDDQLKALKESDGYLFEDDQPGIRGRQPNPNPTPPTPSDAMKKQYDEAIANGNTAQAISIKNQMFNQQKQE